MCGFKSIALTLVVVLVPFGVVEPYSNGTRSLAPSTLIASKKGAAGVVPVVVFVVGVVVVTGRPVVGSVVVVVVGVEVLELDENTFVESPFTCAVVATPMPLSGFSSSSGNWCKVPALSM